MLNESYSHTDDVYFYCSGVLMTVLIGLGVVGNTLTILIFLSPRIWACLNFYIIALAAWDFALLISSFAQWSLWCLWYHQNVPIIGPHIYVLRVAYVCSNTTLTGCVWVTVTLTVERYLAILRPLRHRTLNNAYRAKLLLMIVSAAAVLFNIVRIFELQIDTYKLPKGNQTNQTDVEIPMLTTSTFRADWFFFFFYRVIGSMVFVYFGPCLILAVLTFCMCMAISKATDTRRSLVQHEKNGNGAVCSSSQRSANCRTENNTTGDQQQSVITRTNTIVSHKFHSNNTNKMLAVVLIKFLLCYTLPSITDILEIFADEQTFRESVAIEYLILISNLLVVFNSACNFLIYIVTGQRFRAEFIRKMQHCWMKVTYFACLLANRPSDCTNIFWERIYQTSRSMTFFSDKFDTNSGPMVPETSLMEIASV